MAPEDGITTEDGKAAREGDRVFNYYDRHPVTIDKIDARPDIGGSKWFSTTLDDGSAGPTLDGSRVCSMEFAEGKGWT